VKAFITFAAVAAQKQTGFCKLPVRRQDGVFLTQQDLAHTDMASDLQRDCRLLDDHSVDFKKDYTRIYLTYI
jgi:hypothetical protein